MHNPIELTSFSSISRADILRYGAEELLNFPENINIIAAQRAALPISLSAHANRLTQINVATFKFMTIEARAELEQELLFMLFFVFLRKYRLDYAEDKRKKEVLEYAQHIHQCAKLLRSLQVAQEAAFREAQTENVYIIQLRAELDASDKYGKYLGMMLVAPALVIGIDTLSSGILKDSISVMSYVNQWRLYWVWGGGMLRSVLELLPADFANNAQLENVLNYPSNCTGYMSFVLYYTRFGINLGLLVKHTLCPVGAERNIPIWERFVTQVQQRKFALINDSIWGTCNLLCFVLLYGSGNLGYAGNVLTAVLLLMDCWISFWDWREQHTQYRKDMDEYARAIMVINDEIRAENDPSKRTILEHDRQQLIQNQTRCELDWNYQNYNLWASSCYAVGLLTAFAVVCGFFLVPGALPISSFLLFAAVGAVLCFTFNVMFEVFKGSMNIYKESTTAEAIDLRVAVLLEQFNSDTDPNIKKMLYLDLKQQQAKSLYQHRLVEQQKLQLMHAVFVQAVIPALIFVTFMFMPLGVGLPVFALVLASMIMLDYAVKRYMPKETTWCYSVQMCGEDVINERDVDENQLCVYVDNDQLLVAVRKELNADLGAESIDRLPIPQNMPNYAEILRKVRNNNGDLLTSEETQAIIRVASTLTDPARDFTAASLPSLDERAYNDFRENPNLELINSPSTHLAG